MDLALENFSVLLQRTPESWLQAAQSNLEILLIDHANCEYKAAYSALAIIKRYSNKLPTYTKILAKLAREELRHYEQVLELIEKLGMKFRAISASRYAKSLFNHLSLNEPYRLLDWLIINAIIEARSCERFYSLLNKIKQTEVLLLYRKLFSSEKRHHLFYLNLAYSLFKEEKKIHERIDFFKNIENNLIYSNDNQFRFHSGIPSNKLV